MCRRLVELILSDTMLLIQRKCQIKFLLFSLSFKSPFSIFVYCFLSQSFLVSVLFSLYLPLPLPSFIYLPVFHISLSVIFSLCRPFYIYLCISFPLCLFLSLFVFLFPSVFLSLSLFVFPFPSVFLFSISLCISFSLCLPSHCVILFLFSFLCLFLISSVIFIVLLSFFFSFVYLWCISLFLFLSTFVFLSSYLSSLLSCTLIIFLFSFQ